MNKLKIIQRFKELSIAGYTGRKLMLNGVVTIIVGIVLLVFGGAGSRQIVDIMTTYFFFFGLYNLVTRVWRPEKDRASSAWQSISQILLAAVIGYLNTTTDITVRLIVIVVGIYQLFMALVYAITYWLYRRDNIPQRWRYLVDAIVYALLGVGAMTDYVGETTRQFWLLGIYLLFLGITFLRDGIFFEDDAGMSNLKRQLRVNLPIVAVALIPNSTLTRINNLLHQHEAEALTAAQLYDDRKTDETPDMEVFIHVSESGFGAMGHVDICYQNRVIAFGNYDVLSEKLGGSIGDGVLFRVEREQYIDFCKADGKTLFGYGLRLDAEQKAAVEQQLTELEAQLVAWQPSSALMADGKPMYAYQLQQATGAEFFKFTQGKFKSYFVLSTNCVLLADSIIGRAGTDVLSVRGVISPGTYQDYLDREYAKPSSIVITKAVYQV